LKWKLILSSVFVVGLLLGAVSYSALTNLVSIQNVGTIRSIGVEVYADEALIQILNQITWGTMDPGETRNATAWIKNTGNDAQKLVLWTENWNPTDAQNSINLSWNYTNVWIDSGDSVSVEFMLSVNPEISGISSFSFDIWIKGVA
jgi:hypothetical protein